MKKIALFVCDIMGTITSWSRDDELRKNYLMLIEQLERVREKCGANRLIISFSTSDESLSYLFKYVEEIKPYLNGTKIELGNQYMFYGCYDKNRIRLFSIDGINKIEQIKKQIKSLQREMDVVWVGYADDRTDESAIADITVECSGIPEIYGFIPSCERGETSASDLVSVVAKNNIEGLIECLDNYLDPNIIKNNVKNDVVSDIIMQRKQAEEFYAGEPVNNQQISKEKPIQSILSREKGSSDNNTIPPIEKEPDGYAYLANLGVSLQKNKELDTDVTFVADIFKRLGQSDYSFYAEKPIAREEIIKLRYLKNKYSQTFDIGNLAEFRKDYYDMKKAIERLLSEIFRCGYLHKYTEDEICKVIDKSSILALSLAISPNLNPQCRVRPNKFYRLCDFHREQTPSLVLYERTHSFFCYGCGQGGNIFNYLMRIEDIRFPDAVATLAKAFSVVLPSKDRVNERKDIIEKILKSLESSYYKELLSISNERTPWYIKSEENPQKVLKMSTPQPPVIDEDEDYDLPF